MDDTKKKIRKYLEVIRKACSLIEEAIGDSDLSIQSILEEPEPTPVVPEEPPVDSVYAEYLVARKKHISDLMAIDCWPQAVPDFAVGKPISDRDQENRASAILDTMVNRPTRGLDCLDFGCGDGWVVNELLKREVKSATGYDIAVSDTWSRLKGKFTNQESELATYDMIVLLDVLDHAEDPAGIMKLVRKMLRPGGVVYVRCHPWLSKHGTHVFKQGLNKAYIHLFLKPEEIAELGYNQMFTRSEKNPIQAYKSWFSGFEIEKMRRHTEPLHEFFLVQAFRELLINEQEIPSARQETFFGDMQLQFVDYVLK